MSIVGARGTLCVCACARVFEGACVRDYVCKLTFDLRFVINPVQHNGASFALYSAALPVLSVHISFCTASCGMLLLTTMPPLLLRACGRCCCCCCCSYLCVHVIVALQGALWNKHSRRYTCICSCVATVIQCYFRCLAGMLHATHTCNIIFAKWSARRGNQVDARGVLHECMGVYAMAFLCVCLCVWICCNIYYLLLWIVRVPCRIFSVPLWGLLAAALMLAHIYLFIYVCVCVCVRHCRQLWTHLQAMPIGVQFAHCCFTVNCVGIRAFVTQPIARRWVSTHNYTLHPRWCSKIYNWNCSVGLIFMLEFMVRGLVAPRQVNTN